MHWLPKGLLLLATSFIILGILQSNKPPNKPCTTVRLPQNDNLKIHAERKPQWARDISNSRSSSTVRLVMALDICEGMTMAMVNMYKLARMATEWNANVVLPFVKGDRLRSLPQGAEGPIGLLYDSSAFNKIGAKYGILPFANFDNFMKYSDRKNVYFFYFKFPRKRGQTFQGKVVEKCGNNTVPASSKHVQTIESLNEEARKRGLPEFKVSQDNCCIVYASEPVGVAPKDFLVGCNVIGQEENATILIDEWRGYYKQSSQLKGGQYARLNVPNFSKAQNIPGVGLMYPYSQQVLDSTEDFIRSLTNGDDFIGVHIRAERMQIRSEKKAFNDQKCLSDLMKQVKKTSHRYPHIKHIVYIADAYVEKYASIMNVTISRFVPSELKLQTAGAFIAQVEQSTLSRAKVLIMCGGGTFERLIKNRFKANNPQGEVHEICTAYDY